MNCKINYVFVSLTHQYLERIISQSINSFYSTVMIETYYGVIINVLTNESEKRKQIHNKLGCLCTETSIGMPSTIVVQIVKHQEMVIN